MHFVIIGIIGLMYIFQLGINILNVNHSKKELPNEVSHIYDEDDYKKWMSYHQEHLIFGIAKKTVSVVLTLSLLIFGIFGIFESWASNISESAILQTLVFLGFYLFIDTIISIIFDYIHTFKIEEKYGF